MSAARGYTRWMPLAVVGCILVVTLSPMDGPTHVAPRMCVPCGEQWMVQDVLNALLFLPLGLALRRLGASWWLSIAAGCALSTTVEALQWSLVPGRYAALEDVLANTAGVALAWAVRWPRPRHRTERRAVSGLAVVTLGLGAWSLAWQQAMLRPVALVDTVLQVAPSRRGFAGFDGALLGLMVNGQPVVGTTVPTGRAPAAGASLVTLVADVRVRSLASRPTSILRLVAGGTSFTYLGLRGRRVELRPMVRGAVHALRAPTFGLPMALPPQMSAGGQRAQIIAGVSTETLEIGACLGDASEPSCRSSRVRPGPAQGWLLWIPLVDDGTLLPRAASGAWLALPFLPTALAAGALGTAAALAGVLACAGAVAALVAFGHVVPPDPVSALIAIVVVSIVARLGRRHATG